MNAAAQGWNRVYDAAYGRRYPHEPLIVYVNRLRAAGFDGRRALDVGFGTVADLVMLHEAGYEVDGIDVAENAVRRGCEELAARGIPAGLQVWKPGTGFPFADGTFDLAVAIGCLHYNLDQSHVLKEVARVLRPGGRLMTTYHGPRFHYWAHTEIVRPGVRRYSADYPNVDLRGVEFVYFEREEELAALYGSFFADVEVSPFFYRILGRETSFWIVTARANEAEAA